MSAEEARHQKRVVITTQGDELTPFEMIILILSLYVLGVVFYQTAFELSPDINRLLNYIDTIICIIFIYDFFHRFFRSHQKATFLRWNWIDLASSIPMINIIRFGRLFRVIRILRILRAFRSTKLIVEYLFENRAGGILATVSLVSILLTLSSAIIILNIETDPASNINTPGEALLWSFAILTTVGLADLYPVTTWGKVLAVILMVTGVALAGTFTGYIANVFIESARKPSDSQ